MGMVKIEKYLNTIESFIKKGIDKEKIINGIKEDYKNGKISSKTYEEAAYKLGIMIRKEEYLGIIKDYIKTNSKDEVLLRMVKDKMEGIITQETYAEANKLWWRSGKSILKIKEETDQNEINKSISMMDGKHKINILSEKDNENMLSEDNER